MSETSQLLHEIEAFIGTTDMAASTFGRKAVNDGKLVTRLRAGSTVTLEKASRIRAFIRTASGADADALEEARTPPAPPPRSRADVPAPMPCPFPEGFTEGQSR
ncbi:hypothetical protein [Methylobacterium planeticum]|uniref:Uncharacterized protein n=1 Tax=Methylobacterium planeticum TaxID=2615211 RepID=A0A6N6MF08_9HYPH|nr:hypothetical protein [Methylobacterium planeticum]KAB1068874.1 hypothetical protein F6X51_26080 [Methylobacterium planeticum]